MVDLDDMDDEDYEDQLDQIIIENGILTHAVVNLLVQKGVLDRAELDGEVERLYREADALEPGGDAEERE
ncbi:MAG TPA: hypothetical protein VM534_05335 [Thermoanaerobaculia bacterium]|nr:hypothetical protein [Thermoanaerobaculia bacterium]